MDKVCDYSVSSLTQDKLINEMQKLGQPKFRAMQIFDWLNKKHVCSFDEMKNLPKQLRQKLEEGFCIDVLKLENKQVSKDGTRKLLFGLADGNCVETVLMQYEHGNSLCVSTQVGCRMGCLFCASAQGGLVRNLSAGEMVQQVYAAAKHAGKAISNVVLMGIGEPLDNFEAVMDFINIITSENGLNLSIRNITLSTSGLVPQINKLAQKHLGITLSISLHAANNKLRSSMMPVNDAFPLEILIPACRQYQKTTGRRVSFEYAMVHGVNDDVKKDAKELAGLLRGMGAHVNLIRVNPIDGAPYGTSDEKNIDAFKERLILLGINATVRRRLGADIDAACGQLRRRVAAT